MIPRLRWFDLRRPEEQFSSAPAAVTQTRSLAGTGIISALRCSMVSIKEDLNVTRPFCVYIAPCPGAQNRLGWHGLSLGLLKSKPEYRRVLRLPASQICYFHFRTDIFLRRRLSGSALQALRAQTRWIFLLLIAWNCSEEFCYSSGLLLKARIKQEYFWRAASRNNCGLKYQNM